jgi:hypothetical protein
MYVSVKVQLSSDLKWRALYRPASSLTESGPVEQCQARVEFQAGNPVSDKATRSREATACHVACVSTGVPPSQERFQHAAMRGTGSMSRAAVPMDDESVARGVVAALCRCATECVDLSVSPKVLHTPLSTVTSSAEGAATPPDGGSSSGAAGGGGGSAAGGGGGRKRRPKFMKRAELRKALGTYSDELIPAVRSASS